MTFYNIITIIHLALNKHKKKNRRWINISFLRCCKHITIIKVIKIRFLIIFVSTFYCLIFNFEIENKNFIYVRCACCLRYKKRILINWKWNAVNASLLLLVITIYYYDESEKTKKYAKMWKKYFLTVFRVFIIVDFRRIANE